MMLLLCSKARPLQISHRYFRIILLLGLTSLRTTHRSMSPNTPSSKRATRLLYTYGLCGFSPQYVYKVVMFGWFLNLMN